MRLREVNEDYVTSAIARAAKDHGSQKAFAAYWKCSESYVSDVVNGRRAPPKEWARELGFHLVWMQEA